MTVRNKILLPMIALTIMCSVFVLMSSVLLFRYDLHKAAERRIRIASTAAENAILRFTSASHRAALGFARDKGLLEAIRSGDREKIFSEAARLQLSSSVDYCVVHDNRGTVLARTFAPDRHGDNNAHLPHNKAALSGRTMTVITPGITHRLAVATGTPAYDAHGNITAVVAVGFRLDTHAFVESLKKSTGSDASVFLGDERLATTVLQDDGTPAVGTKADAEVSARVLSGRSHDGIVHVEGKEALTRYVPLCNSEGGVLGMVAGCEFRAETAQNLGRYITSGVFITLIILGISVTVAAIVAQKIDGRLTGMMNQVLEEKSKTSEAEERTLCVFDAMPHCVTLWDSRLNIIDCNPASARLFGLLNENEFMENFFSFMPPFQPDGSPSIETAFHQIRKAFETGQNHMEWMYRTQKGEPLPCEITMTRVQYKDDYIVAASLTDLRDRKQAQEMEKRHAEAEAANKAKSEFLARMSHEIRTPMNAIMGITEIQMYDESLPEETKEALSRIYVAGDILLRIINDILDLSKVQSGKLELSLNTYELASLINDAVQLNIFQHESKPIEFDLLIDPKTPSHLFGDELRTRQVLSNLLSNAFKYTNKGKVTLSIMAESSPETKDIALVCKVSDTGQGMTPEQIEQLYDEYTRFNPDTNRTTSGTGLGMAITQHFVQMMNGDISVESEVGRGTTFTVRLMQEGVGTEEMGQELTNSLKRNTFSGFAQAQKAQIKREPMPYGKVLLVDDVETNLYVAKLLLAPYRLQVETASNGLQAVEKIKSGQEYHLVFMDHMMPVMNGMEATARIRGLGYERPVVALTANALAGHSQMYLANGFDGFLSKPIDVRELNALLNRLVRDKQPPEVLEAARRSAASAPVKVASAAAAEGQLFGFFARDAEKALEALQNILELQGTYSDDDFETYRINTHSMKTTLALIGETQLSDAARTLEAAGKAHDAAAIAAKTPDFLEALHKLVDKHKKPKDLDEAGAFDELLLREKLLVIQKACAEMDKKLVKGTLAELAKQSLPRRIHEPLEEISHLLIVSDFEAAAQAAEKIMAGGPHGSEKVPPTAP
ncbi:MAG: response regulator [Deltaproteobacteria bacterium]|jgi:PAS domain S-box-containing protein|nr:response regulator [Deltaproteobacteria bacterium]